jgi:hypothetical protein
MFSALFCSLFGETATARTARLALDTFEDRVVPSSVTFNNGVLFVTADQTTNDYVRITPIGTATDGSTGVKLVTNVTGTWTTQQFTDPVTNIALDLKDGNDFVNVASLRQTIVLVGEGNGNNFVRVGDTISGGVIAGSGQNVISVGNGTVNGFGSFNLPGVASSVAFVGWGYNFVNGGTAFFLNGNTGNANDNFVEMRSKTGYTAFVDLVGTGNNVISTGAGNDGVSVIGGGDNWIFTGNGNDLVKVQGDGNNHVFVGAGDDTVTVNGNGDNSVWAFGSGSVTVNGTGGNSVFAAFSSGLTIALNGAGADSSVVASLTDGVYVDGTQVTQSGTAGNVQVWFVDPQACWW